MDTPVHLTGHAVVPSGAALPARRVLAIDGAGAHAVAGLAALERIEALLAIQHDRPDLRLADYFNLIGGSGTGALIAGALAQGWRARDLTDLLTQLSRDGRAKRRPSSAPFRRAPLLSMLHDLFGCMTMGTGSLKTGFAVVTHRVGRGAVVLDRVDHPTMTVADAVRVSLPSLARGQAERLRLAQGEEAAFDPAASGAQGDAASPLLDHALAKAGGPGSPDRLLLVSVGSVLSPGIEGVARRADLRARGVALSPPLPGERPAMASPTEAGPQCAFIRCAVPLKRGWLGDRVKALPSYRQLVRMEMMHRPEDVEALLALSRQVVSREIRAEFFPARFRRVETR